MRPAGPLPSIPKRDRSTPAPLSFPQQRLWFLDRLEPGTPVYNIPQAVRLDGPLDHAVLERALQALAARHEILRTRFALADGEPAQIVAADAGITLPLVDLSDMPAAQRDADVERRRDAEARMPFDLSRGPLARATLLRVGERSFVLLFTAHHIVADGWSLDVFYRELGALYDALLNDAPPALAELPIQYADFALWQRERMRGELLERELVYWRERLGGALPILDLPGDRPRPAVQTHRGATAALRFPAALGERLNALARGEGVTLFMVLVAAFKTLLYRYSGQTDVLIGTPVANRERGEIEGLIGFFANTLVLRTDLSGDPDFRTLLGRVRDAALGAYAHQSVPFEKLVEVINPARSLSRAPLFQVMFVFQNTPRSPLRLPGVNAEVLPVRTDAAMFDLNVVMREADDGSPYGRIEYNTDLFDKATIERWIGHFRTLLESVVADPGARLSRLELLPAPERRRLLEEWNDTAVAFPAAGCLQQLFEAQAARTPAATALRDGARELSYRALNEQANRLARHLETLGAGPRSLVAVCLERSAATVAGLLAIVKTGAAYVPLDPAYPAARLTFMLTDSRAGLLLTETRLRGRLPAGDARVVCIDEPLPDYPADDRPAPVAADDLAYVIYTSGSTGQPKGVEAPHRAALNRLQWMWQAYPFRPDEVCCQKTALSFVDSVWEIWGPLLQGVTSVIIPSERLADARALVETLGEQRVTRIVLVPSLLRNILDAYPDLSTRLPVLKHWICSGETLPAALVGDFVRQMPAGRLLNLYGSSEVAADATCYDTGAWDGASSVAIGRPIANVRAYVLDDERRLLPVGVPGELYIGGLGLARGYLGRPELTAERFVVDPFGDGAARLYRTGDRARYRADGNLELLGRSDHQIKLRGMRVELGEIEAALADHPDVRAAVVALYEPAPGDQRLAAYIEASGAALPAAERLRDHLLARLPDYMVPALYLRLDALPLLPNGKVDRSALPAPVPARVAEDGAYLAPRTPGERQVAAVWAEVLGVAEVGVRDDFFDLGGHSLLAMRLVSALETRLGLQVPVMSLFQGGTVEQMAAGFGADAGRPAAPALRALRESGTERPFFACGSHPRYADIAAHMDPRQPVYRLDVYALQSLRLQRRQAPYRSIEDLAGYFVEEIRRLQPSGPYSFGGGCEGSLVALEMANRLQAGGEQVEAVVLWLAPILDLPAAARRSSVARAAAHLRSLLGRASLRDLRPKNLAHLLRHERLELAIFRAMENYRPARVFDGRLTMLRFAANLPRDGSDPAGPWAQRAARGVDVVRVPGDHETLLTHHAPELGRLIQTCLSEARERYRSPTP